jgi:hypothetical protein
MNNISAIPSVCSAAVSAFQKESPGTQLLYTRDISGPATKKPPCGTEYFTLVKRLRLEEGAKISPLARDFSILLRHPSVWTDPAFDVMSLLELFPLLSDIVATKLIQEDKIRLIAATVAARGCNADDVGVAFYKSLLDEEFEVARVLLQLEMKPSYLTYVFQNNAPRASIRWLVDNFDGILCTRLGPRQHTPLMAAVYGRNEEAVSFLLTHYSHSHDLTLAGTAGQRDINGQDVFALSAPPSHSQIRRLLLDAKRLQKVRSAAAARTIQRAATHQRYRFGGPGYHIAKSHFESLRAASQTRKTF